ncbi:MAG: hypothetical protein SPI71_02765 [Acidaminococcaceae bacterium]|nr:hypothetical protein [Acidaminococcaceae bacterium]
MTVDFIIDEVRENFRIKEFLKKVDTKFYYRAIENKKKEGKVFPHRGEDGRLFMNTYQYVNLFPKKKEEE